MRKAIILLFMTCALLGGILHYSLSRKILDGEYVSKNSESMNICAQGILWLPFSTIIGFALLVYPKKLINWLIEPLSENTRNGFKSINFLALRLFGLLLLITNPIPSILRECKVFFDF